MDWRLSIAPFPCWAPKLLHLLQIVGAHGFQNMSYILDGFNSPPQKKKIIFILTPQNLCENLEMNQNKNHTSSHGSPHCWHKALWAQLMPLLPQKTIGSYTVCRHVAFVIPGHCFLFETWLCGLGALCVAQNEVDLHILIYNTLNNMTKPNIEPP